MKAASSRTVPRYPLGTLADIYPGYPFRGSLPLNPEGEAFVVQFRHIGVGGEISDRTGESLDRVELTGKKSPTYLETGDVLVMAKGTRNQAAVIQSVPENTVCTPNFYHIRLNSPETALLPAFLAWQINHLEAQRYFKMCSQGSLAPSITKSQLSSLPIAIPPMTQQQTMVSLAEAAFREQQLLNELIENRQQMIDAVGQNILNPENLAGK